MLSLYNGDLDDRMAAAVILTHNHYTNRPEAYSLPIGYRSTQLSVFLAYMRSLTITGGTIWFKDQDPMIFNGASGFIKADVAHYSDLRSEYLTRFPNDQTIACLNNDVARDYFNLPKTGTAFVKEEAPGVKDPEPESRSCKRAFGPTDPLVGQKEAEAIFVRNMKKWCIANLNDNRHPGPLADTPPKEPETSSARQKAYECHLQTTVGGRPLDAGSVTVEPKPQKELKISVAGFPNTGKSAILALIMKMLREQGLITHIGTMMPEEDVEDVLAWVKDSLKLSEYVKELRDEGLKIDLVEHRLHKPYTPRQ